MDNQLGENLRRMRGSRSQGELAAHIGVESQTWGNWERGTRRPSIPTLLAICKFFKVTMDELCGRPNDETDGIETVLIQAMVPVVGMAAAAHYNPSLSPITEVWESTDEFVPYTGIHPQSAFGVQIVGDSMSPAIVEGDIVIALYDVFPVSGKCCLALHRRDGILCKKWVRKDNLIRLESLNRPEGRDYEWTMDEYMQENPLIWCYKVEAVFRKNIF